MNHDGSFEVFLILQLKGKKNKTAIELLLPTLTIPEASTMLEGEFITISTYMYYTRIFRHYVPLILAPAGDTWSLRLVLGPSGPYPVSLRPMPTSNLVSHGYIRGDPFFEFFRSDVCSQSYEVNHASSLHTFGR